MVSHVGLVAMLLLVGAFIPTSSRGSSAGGIEYADSENYDQYHLEEEKPAETKRKWDSDKMGPRGDRYLADYDHDLIPTEAEKRKWTSGKMGLWGKRFESNTSKRKWDSKNMGFWGRKRSQQSAAPSREGDDHDDDIILADKRRWSPSGMGVWGKRLDSAINQIRSQKSKWTSGSMGMWGK